VGRLFQKLPSKECRVSPSSEAFMSAIGSSQRLEKKNYISSSPLAPSCSKCLPPARPPCIPPRRGASPSHPPHGASPRGAPSRTPAQLAAATRLAPCGDRLADRRDFGLPGFRGFHTASCESPNPAPQAGVGGGGLGKGSCPVPGHSFLVAKEHFASSAIPD